MTKEFLSWTTIKKIAGAQWLLDLSSILDTVSGFEEINENRLKLAEIKLYRETSKMVYTLQRSH